jgi:hypothetical protein
VEKPAWLTANALLDVDPYQVVKRDAACWLRDAKGDGYRDWLMEAVLTALGLRRGDEPAGRSGSVGDGR